MGAHVRREAAGLREVLAAGGADVGAVAGMYANVVLQASSLREGLAACEACVGAIASMGANMILQICRCGEGLFTGGALKVARSQSPAFPSGSSCMVVGEPARCRQGAPVWCGTEERRGRQHRD